MFRTGQFSASLFVKKPGNYRLMQTDVINSMPFAGCRTSCPNWPEGRLLFLLYHLLNTAFPMITIKIMLRASSVPGRKSRVYYQLTQHSKVRQLSSALRIAPEDWDATLERVRPEVINGSVIQQQLDEDLQYLRRIVELAGMYDTPVHLDDVAVAFRQSHSRKAVLETMAEEICQLRKRNQLVTAVNYGRALKSFSLFLNGCDIPFSLLTEPLVNHYEVFLMDRGLVRNSISFYMRILRAVYNKAVKRHWVMQSYPFQNVYTGIDRTCKRAISEYWIARLYKMKLRLRSAQDLARDLFIFSYCTRGMAFVDMAHLMKKDIHQGRISYCRHKTRQPLCIRVDEVQGILDKYAAAFPHSPYVFPILKGEGAVADFKRYYASLNTYNRMLKKLAAKVGMDRDCQLTSYVARHSWATSARNHQVPLSVISAGLGHESEKTTEIYLKRLEDTVVDSANLEIIKGVLR